MKRFLTISFAVLALILSTAGAAPAVHAQNDLIQEPPGSEQVTTPENDAGLIDVPPGTSDPAAEQTPKTYSAPESNSKDSEYNWIMIKIMSLFAWLVGVAAITLDYAVYYTVVKMGDYVNSLSAVGVTWQIMRDIGNIVIIFGFLAAGIATIINVDMYGWGKKMLPMLLVAAVFLNFSLFLAEAVIDTGNLFATQFYTQIKGGSLPTGVSLSLTTIESEGISNKIMSQLGLTTIYGKARESNTELFKAGNPWIIGFMGILLFIVTAFVLFSLAFILIARFVILLFLIIVAPIGFAGLAVPRLESTAKLWWSKLFEQTITAPVLLLLLYIALRVITDTQFLTGFGTRNPDWTGTITNNIGGFAPVFLSFLVAMGLLLAVVILSKKMSAFGAGMATKAAGALSFGATAWGMRTSGGWLANKTARGLRKTWVARVPFAGTGLVKGLERVGSASFDMRGIKAGGGLKGIGVEAGEAQKGGYRADLKSRIESRTKYASELTGRELNDQEKIDVAGLGVEIKNDTKELQKLRARGADVATVKVAEDALKEKEKKLEKIESVTDRGAQRKYATVLELGINPKSKWQWLNPAANTEAAKKIRGEAKKSKADKDWAENMKKALKEAAKEDEEAGTSGPRGGTPPADGGAGTLPRAEFPDVHATPSGGDDRDKGSSRVSAS